MNIEPKALLSDGEGIPTTTDNYFNYDYGEEINQKLRSLFCPTCLCSMMDMADQFRGEDDED